MLKKKKEKKSKELKQESLNLLVLVGLIILTAVFFFKIIRIFVIPLILAATFATLLYPLFKKLLKLFKNKRGISSLVFIILIIICGLIPLYFIGHLITLQAIDFYNTLEKFITTSIEEGDKGIISDILKWPIFDFFQVREYDLSVLLQEGIKSGSVFITKFINRTSTGVLGIIAGIFFTFYTMFYFFKDGPKIITRLRYLSPLRDEYEEKLIQRFGSISKATVKGTFVIGLIQGLAGTLTFVIFGIKGWVLWGFVMIILSIVPVVGTYLIMIPVAIFKIAAGALWQGLVIILVAIILNYAIDYLLRPILVGNQSKMHDLLIFITTLGGIGLFGIMGFIVGPMVAMFFMTLLDIYGMEFKDLLH